jgi:ABC-type branched-subunit amino acid transport system ATPase component
MLGVLFVDQSVERALACSDRIYAMDNGRMALTGSSAEVLSSELVRIIVGPVTAPATA